MKKFLIVLNIAIWSLVGYQFAHAAEPSAEKQKVCIKDEKTGKETCKMMKVHKKLEGTQVPPKK